MHDLALADAARPAPVRILRLPMFPYSIGHEITLLSQRNPLLFDAPLKQPMTAIIQAALICSRTWRQQGRRERNMRLWGWLIRKSDPNAEIAAFHAYRAAGSSCPPSPTQENYEIANGLEHEEQGRAFGGSHLARLLAYAATVHRALGHETPYDVPMGLANHLYLSELELAGNVRIENEREAQVRIEMEQHKADIAKEKQCQP
jgi:hypothetical protein